jgi:NAD-dependent protein deacetylases, SIR2 family
MQRTAEAGLHITAGDGISLSMQSALDETLALAGDCPEAEVAALESFIAGHRRLLVLTGAGCSTGSGIPDYRDAEGGWKRTPPVTYQAFTGEAATRRRYWARSLAGWQYFAAAQPNAAHAALAALEAAGRVELLVTQNVDGLHQRAGSRAVVDLHGSLDAVVCLGCGDRRDRAGFQAALLEANPGWDRRVARIAPDGDADLEDADYASFQVPGCPHCGGMLKPDVVFFGESAPRARVEQAVAALHRSDAMLVVGSSLMVYSGFRFARMAAEAGIPVAAVNLGRTRADELLALKVRADCASALSALAGTTMQ